MMHFQSLILSGFSLLGLAMVSMAGAATSQGVFNPAAAGHLEFKSDNLCGPRCVAVAAQLTGVNLNLDDFVKICKVTEQGMTLFDLKGACEKAGFEARGMRLDWKQLKKAGNPVILFVGGNHFIVADPRDATETSIPIHDPPQPSYPLSKDELEKVWNGEALILRRPLPHIDLQTPQIAFPRLLLDFGTKKAGETVTDKFEFTNRGSADLEIIQVEKSCGCTEAEVSSTLIAPGQTGFVNFSVDLEGRSGPQAQTIQLLTNDPKNSQIQLIVQGSVAEGMYLNKGALDFGSAIRGQTKAMELEVSLPADYSNEGLQGVLEDDLKLFSVTAPAALQASSSEQELRRLPATKAKFKVVASVAETAEMGIHESTLVVHHPDEESAKRIPVLIEVVPQISAIPPSLSFGVLSNGKTVTRTIRLTDLSGAPIDSSRFAFSVDSQFSELPAPVLARTHVEGKDLLIEYTLSSPIESSFGPSRLAEGSLSLFTGPNEKVEVDWNCLLKSRKTGE